MPFRFRKNFILLALIIITASLVYFSHQWNANPQVKGATECANCLVIYFFDVGQGDSGLIRTSNGQDILIDGGPDNRVLEKLGQYLPLGDNDIEMMVLTHPHADHVTGLVGVLERYQVKKILMTKVPYATAEYQTFLNLIKEKDIATEIVSGQETITLEASTTLDIIWPLANIAGQHFSNPNNSSIVFSLSYVSSTALLMGDLEQEEELTADYPDLIKADLLKVGHHGSNNANDLAFLLAVSPQYAVISAGANNRYGHPQYRALKNLEKAGAEIFRTDQQGDLIFYSNGWGFKPVD
ncbi:MAG: hypothetical protein A3B89_02005 [Candidatus Buchananbacteria bacterium RIFCSPHIGHO2_02_FULL_40_13]|uniref:Metallo-beta-lactamase domain-containing protein n=1 Tax=Candidatus Buchananbacteria bacterium RIFCSPLOWO2_01_FULL_39_33 TaxID=1797543 RepID=A0A1G1YNL8_9BACT|nr:MAG: hypothetical protein A2820_02635 [Candidatus Buchananbacteria bacterium RIFCSPHIGHO2_01_FULL_40_35]OGY50556.1 MAG: hypothetical protein A3B89_02005 [Candidatus Buchananbacteria bacterium RIFCSPHIGHO2_02_FULL_40_13]OGY53027.1 MAG: hypothetical protein A3A02_02885 [Candidatus Buchananbacteria bacterium RIFCSPLOWO2_01_FULL_39_33]